VTFNVLALQHEPIGINDALFFPGFQVEDVSTSGASIRTLRKGSGPPLLLLHGYPQTHLIWHKIANRLGERYAVVLTDLRAYGDSSKPDGAFSMYGESTHTARSKDARSTLGTSSPKSNQTRR
jgi:haloacetate dehalogenase